MLEGGEGEAEKAASEPEKPAEEPKKEEPAPAKEEEDDPYPEPVLSECCCCDCACSNEFTEGYSYCICFPIKCGVAFIGGVTLFLTGILFVWYFFQFMNEYLHWWYVLVSMFLIAPLIVAASFVISFFTKDNKTTRTLLYTSQILGLVSVILLALWNIIYFVAIYKKDVYYSGMGDIEKNVYVAQSKKVFLFIMIAESVLMVIFFAYSIWVTSTYAELMHGKGAFNDDSEKDEEEK